MEEVGGLEKSDPAKRNERVVSTRVEIRKMRWVGRVGRIDGGKRRLKNSGNCEKLLKSFRRSGNPMITDHCRSHFQPPLKASPFNLPTSFSTLPRPRQKTNLLLRSFLRSACRSFSFDLQIYLSPQLASSPLCLAQDTGKKILCLVIPGFQSKCPSH